MDVYKAQIIRLLKDFIDEKIEAESFVIQYIRIWREVRDFHYTILGKHPDISQKLSVLFEQYLRQQVSQEAYSEQWSELIKHLPAMTIYPYSKEEDAISHLMVEVDAYRDDPSDRQPGIHIGEQELRSVVLETLKILVLDD